MEFVRFGGIGGVAATGGLADITIANAFNDGPTAVAAATGSASENATAFTLNLLSTSFVNDLDLTQIGTGPNGEELAVTSHSVASSVGWTGAINYSVSPAGELSLNPTQFNALPAAQSVVIVINYTVTDVHGATVANTATITINGANDAPALVGTVNPQIFAEQSTVSFAVPPSVFADPDTNSSGADTLTLSATLANGNPLPSWLTFVPATGQFSGTPDDAQVGQITVRVTATDNNAASTFADFTLTVSPVNDVPTGGVAIATTATEDTTLTATSTLADADGLGTLTYQWQSSADGNAWTNVGSNSASFTPGDAEVGRQVRVVTTYTDGQGTLETITSNATTATVAINDAAIIFGTIESNLSEQDGALTNSATLPLTSNLSSTDVDGVDDAFTAVSTTATTSGYGTFAVTAEGVWTYTLNNANPSVNELTASNTLSDTFTVFAADGTPQLITITITGTNDGPVAVTETLSAVEDTPITFMAADLLDNDTDVDANTTLTIGSVTSGVGGTVELVGGNVVFTPAENFNGPATFSYTATDGIAQSLTTTVTVNVAAVDDRDDIRRDSRVSNDSTDQEAGLELIVGSGIPVDHMSVATDVPTRQVLKSPCAPICALPVLLRSTVPTCRPTLSPLASLAARRTR